MARVLLAVPHGSKPLEPEALEALWRLDGCGREVVFRIVSGYDCARARNAIAQTAIDLLCEHVLMVDSDVVVPPDALGLLLEGGAQVALGCYPRKDDSGRAELFGVAAPRYSEVLMWDALPQGRFPVNGGGFGCALVETSVFRRLARPWFAYVEHISGDALSEDLYFCESAANAGFRIEADGRVRCRHIGRRVYG